MKNDIVKNCEYYYDIKEASILNTMYYEDALNYKIDQANLLLDKLLANGYMQADTERVKDVYNAIAFNKKLIGELYMRSSHI